MNRWRDLGWWDPDVTGTSESERIHQRLESFGKVYYPPWHEVYNAFFLTPFEKVRVVILGQDPYHTFGAAHGLAFSSKTFAPPSLQNIFKELQADLGITRTRIDLTDWAQQGILLLNTVLTVEEGNPGSHIGLGWEKLTYSAIRAVIPKNPVFVLWGRKARAALYNICPSLPDKVIVSNHPSPFSCQGFFGTKPFSRVNSMLDFPIRWG